MNSPGDSCNRSPPGCARCSATWKPISAPCCAPTSHGSISSRATNSMRRRACSSAPARGSKRSRHRSPHWNVRATPVRATEVAQVARVASRAQVGLTAPVVEVEVHLGPGLPNFALVGLPAAAVRESRERVRSALACCGFELPAGRITVNLAPADLPKEGGRFDLSIAVGILIASGQVRAARDLADCELYGELGLGGELRAVHGLLP